MRERGSIRRKRVNFGRKCQNKDERDKLHTVSRFLLTSVVDPHLVNADPDPDSALGERFL